MAAGGQTRSFASGLYRAAVSFNGRLSSVVMCAHQAGQSTRQPKCLISHRARYGTGVRAARQTGCWRTRRGGRRELPWPSTKQRSLRFWNSMVPAPASRRSGPRIPMLLGLNYLSCA